LLAVVRTTPFLTLLCLALALAPVACAATTAERVGDIVYPPLAADAPVAVFQDERSVGAPFTVIGELDVDQAAKQQLGSIEALLPRLTTMARELGANGIIVDAKDVVVAGVVSRGYAGHARAIRIFSASSGSVAGATAPLRGRLLSY
jgi:hypothetical protein